jgi:FkbM family methyltransferase
MTLSPKPSSIKEILELLPGLAADHARTTDNYRLFDELARSVIASSGLSKESPEEVSLGYFGNVVFPFEKMGAISTLDLFGLDELIIFSFYWINRHRYRNVVDIGANLGLHSILMGKCGWKVTAYEPDPNHIRILRRNLELNKSDNVEVIEAAVSDEPGSLEFVRVLGNTTSSHLAGAKNNTYGLLERFPVKVETIAAIMPTVDFIKMDAEGQEKAIILGTTESHWNGTDMMVEIGSQENANAIYAHLELIGINAFAQKLGWNRVRTLEDMPNHYTNGSLFITQKASMPWGA